MILNLALFASLISQFPLGDTYLFQLAPRLPLPGTPSPAGSPWPLPAEWETSPEIVSLNPDWTYSSNVEDCPILSKAFTRYGRDLIFRDKDVTIANGLPILSQVSFIISEEKDVNLCGEYPKLVEEDPDYESYQLEIKRNGDAASAEIISKTVWGALRAIETFSQLLWVNPEEEVQGIHHFYLNLTTIRDHPRFPHRGLMIDTARHFLPPNLIMEVLDGLSYTKMNVLHWHTVDDQSFPFVSSSFPELSEKGAYSPSMIYDPQTVQSIIEYARDLGIRVIFEFDTPGHTHGFGKSHKELLTPCYGDGVTPGTPDFPNHAAYEILDPTRERTFDFMREFFKEIISNVSKEEYVHLGMDEVYYACWNSSKEIKEFMDLNGFQNVNQVQEYYARRHLEMIQELGSKSIVWNDPLIYGVDLQKDVIVQVWKGSSGDWPDYWKQSLDLGYKSLLSSCWYLNYINYGESWRKYFECEPFIPGLSEAQKKLILGGEAAVWSEFVDRSNLIPRIFPFIGAVAERLWSPMASSSTDDAMWRLDEMRCRMLWRGIAAQPIFNGYCGDWDNAYPPLRKYRSEN